MKHILFYTSLLIITFITGCKKLDEQVFSSLPSVTDEKGASASVLGVYKGFFSDWQAQVPFLVLQESGHEYSSYGTGGDWWNEPFYNYELTDNNDFLARTWKMIYKVINRANDVIESLPASVKDQALANSMVGEAKFLRAWGFFKLTQFWGKIPLHLESTKSLADEKGVFKSRTSVDSVYGQIIDDLKFAAAHLPQTRTTADLGRATSAAAKGLLGKVYLTMAGKPLNQTDNYQKAVDILSELVNNESTYALELLANYRSIFDPSNEMNKEVIFAFRGNAIPSDDNGTIWPWAFCSPGMTWTVASTNGLRWDISRMYEPQDIRLYEGIGMRYPWVGDGSILINGKADTIYYDTVSTFNYVLQSNPSVTFGNSHVGIGYMKWRHPEPPLGWPGGHQKDYIELRYADIILLLAEALNETDRPIEALELINRIRNRAGASSCPNGAYPGTNKASIAQLIRDERRRELVGEGSTIMDIRRWGTLPTEIASMRQDQFPEGRKLPVYNSKLELYPIPITELATNPNLLPQNPGW